MHSCRDSFLLALAALGRGMNKRDLASNINFFMNVPVTPEGGLTFADGISGAGPLRRDARRDGRAGADLQLPAAQQPVQRLQPDAGAPADLGRPAGANDVQQGPDRQPRRDRLPHPPHAAPDGRRRRSPSTPRPIAHALHVAHGRRGGAASARRPRRESYLRRRRDPRRPRARPARGDPSRLRLPERERRLRRGLRGGRASPSSARRRSRCATSASSTRRASWRAALRRAAAARQRAAGRRRRGAARGARASAIR